MLVQSGNAGNDNHTSNVSSQGDSNTHSSQNKNVKPQPKPLSGKNTRELGKLISKLEEQITKVENERNVLQSNLAQG
ncbi:hypothetical protein [Helicobacter labacensis]|uniref:hypothetical protein n=1 Tax=Helicobacter labacensis TaxID=2316079 RepID=UPI000EAF2448|nr:hypothetical protein [Helicobacter labacensis]